MSYLNWLDDDTWGVRLQQFYERNTMQRHNDEATKRALELRLAEAHAAVQAAQRELARLAGARRAVMGTLPGTAKRYAYLVREQDPMPQNGDPVALPDPYGHGWMIGRVSAPRSGDDLSRATKYLRIISWTLVD